MFKKILASVGIGAAKVDTVLQTELCTLDKNFMPKSSFKAVMSNKIFLVWNWH